MFGYFALHAYCLNKYAISLFVALHALPNICRNGGFFKYIYCIFAE